MAATSPGLSAIAGETELAQAQAEQNGAQPRSCPLSSVVLASVSHSSQQPKAAAATAPTPEVVTMTSETSAACTQRGTVYQSNVARRRGQATLARALTGIRDGGMARGTCDRSSSRLCCCSPSRHLRQSFWSGEFTPSNTEISPTAAILRTRTAQTSTAARRCFTAVAAIEARWPPRCPKSSLFHPLRVGFLDCHI